MSEQRIGPYEVTRLLGEGAYGRVYAAVDTRLGRTVAIKALRSEIVGDGESLSRFRAEARNLAGLNHPNIAMLLDIYEEGSSETMIMEFVSGKTLEEILARTGILSAEEALSVVVQAASGLLCAHKGGLIHRDIKPSNLMISDSGTVKIMDFGIARTRGSLRQTKAGQAMGTPIYLSPEQCRGGEGDEQSDQYSLAVVLFELLSGRPPFEAENEFDLMRAHLEAPPPAIGKFVPQAPRILGGAIARALSKKPSDRFESVEAFARAAGADAVRSSSSEILLKLLLSVDGLHTQESRDALIATPASHAPVRVPRKTLLSVLAIALVMIIGGVGAAYFLTRSGDPVAALPAPPDKADLSGDITNIISGNAISVNAITVNLYGISDKAKSSDDVIAAQNALKSSLPKTAICYKKPGHNFQCFDGDKPHQDISLIAIESGVAKARADTPETIYRDTERHYLERR